jgi:hypothetical protein
MAQMNEEEGTIVARCPNCRGALSSFTWFGENGEFGAITKSFKDHHWSDCLITYRLFQCGGCGMGALGVIKFGGDYKYPGKYNRLIKFTPEAKKRLELPDSVPDGIKREFNEAEMCMENNCLRAAAGLFRSVLDKTMRANGYKTKKESSLYKQIEAAADDGVITRARKKRAHDEIRVLGNDVLHDEWQEIPVEDVEAAQHYSQRILEDLYDDRESVLSLLRDAGRKAQEDVEASESES